MDRVDTRKLLPQEVYGEIKALTEAELSTLANTPLDGCPDVKSLFLLGIYTAQRTGEMKKYSFKILYDKYIRVRQGKTGKFISIPLSAGALRILEELRERRIREGRGGGRGEIGWLRGRRGRGG